MLSSFVILQYSGVNIGPVHKKDIMKCSTMLEHDSQWVPFNLIQQIYVMVARPPLIKIFLSQPFARPHNHSCRSNSLHLGLHFKRLQ